MRRYYLATGITAAMLLVFLAGMVLVRAPARMGPLVATIPAGSAGTTPGTSFPPLVLAANGRAVIADTTSGRVQIVDTIAGCVIGTFRVTSSNAFSVHVATDTQLQRAFVLWLTPGLGINVLALAAVDLPSGHVLATFPHVLSLRSIGTAELFPSVDTRRHRLFVVTLGDPETALLLFDTMRLHAMRKAALGVWPTVGGPVLDGVPLAVDEQAGLVLAGRIDGEIMPVFDAGSGRLVRTIPLTMPLLAPIAVPAPVVAPGLARVYVPNLAGNTVTTLDERTGAIIRTVRLPFQLAPPLVDVAAHRVFVPYADQDGFAVLDARSGRLLWTHTYGSLQASPGFPQAALPSIPAVALDERGHRAFELDDASGTVTVDSLRIDHPRGVLWSGIHPTALAIDQRHNRVLVADAGPCCVDGQPAGNGTLVVLDGASGRVLRRVGVGRSPRQILLDQADGRVLVVNGEGGTAADPDPWRWVPAPIRQHLPFLSRPRPHIAPPDVMIFDLKPLIDG